MRVHTPPVEFVPTNRGGSTSGAQATGGRDSSHLMNQGRTFVPNQGKTMGDSSMTGHLGASGAQPSFTPQRDFFNPNGSTGMNSMPGGNTSGGLNIASAEFQRPMSNQNMGMMGQGVGSAFDPPKSQEINIHSREFQPSRSTQDNLNNLTVRMAMSPNVHHQPPSRQQHQVTESQYQELLDIQTKISEKIKKAVDAEAKVRLDDILEDETITVDSDTIEDIRCICNNTGK